MITPEQTERLNKYLRANKEMFAGVETPELCVGYIDYPEQEHWTDEKFEELLNAMVLAYRQSDLRQSNKDFAKEAELVRRWLNKAPDVVHRTWPEFIAEIETYYEGVEPTAGKGGRPPKSRNKVVEEVNTLMRSAGFKPAERARTIAELLLKHGLERDVPFKKLVGTLQVKVHDLDSQETT